MIKAAKADLRKHQMTIRARLHLAVGEAAPLRLLSHLFPATPRDGFSVVSGFHPYGSEIDTRQLLGKLAGDGWTTALPVVVNKYQPLSFRRWLPGEPLEIGAMKIHTPLSTALEVAPDVLLVPLLAFDKSGYRLGYGGGFYDATLANLRTQKKIIAIGVGYAGQEIAEVPHEAHDMRLDYMMTEKGIIQCV